MKSRFTADSLILILFVLLSILVTYPTAARLSDFTVVATDSLLQAWTLKWDGHALLSGPDGVQHLWDTNILYPYPITLAFSEHLLSHALLLLPFTLLGTTPMVAANLGVLLTTLLSGWGMYLLVTWLTGDRRAGLVAGVFYAVCAFRIGHIIQLHLLSTHWIPFVFLAMARLIRRNRDSDLILLLIFTNLQFFSALNYIPIVGIGLAIWTVALLLRYRMRVSRSLVAHLALFVAVTLALNWPVFQRYRDMSEVMGIVRTLGDARVYGASIAHYTLPIINSLLYVRWLQLPALIDSAFPGIVVMTLAVAGIALAFGKRKDRPSATITGAALVIALVGFALSFGANELAFGERLAPVVSRLLPYPYLFDAVPLLQGFRVPARFALLATFGLAILAGIGLARLGQRVRWKPNSLLAASAMIGLLVVVEHLAAPLPGVSVRYGSAVYEWLSGTDQDAVVIELPYYLHTERSHLELERVYQSPVHWRRLVNGTSGFKPRWSAQMGHVLDAFPDWRSFALLRGLGVDYVVLHRDQYDDASWANLLALLPGYLPSIDSLHSVDDDLVLRLRPPQPDLEPSQMRVDASAFPVISFSNHGPVTFVADPRLESLATAGSQQRRFLEPLFVLPGQTERLTLPLEVPPDGADWQVVLGNLGHTLAAGDEPASRPSVPVVAPDGWQPVNVPYANGAILQDVVLGGSVETGGEIALSLRWAFSAYADELIQAQLVDRFGRLVISSDSQPDTDVSPVMSSHTMPLAATVTPGLYQIQVRLLAADGTEIAAIDTDGDIAAAPPALPIIIRPGPQAAPDAEHQDVSRFANGVTLLGADVDQADIASGQWVRFTLHWQSGEQMTPDHTVFTQLIGPNGRVWGQHDNPPRGGWYPISLWSPGERVMDDYAVRIKSTAPPGDYRLIVGLYDPTSEVRATVTHGPGQGSDFVEVTTITVR